MRYVLKNGKILDGSRDMQVREGYCILVDEDKITDILPGMPRSTSAVNTSCPDL